MFLQCSAPASSMSTSTILQKPLSRFTRCLSWTVITMADSNRKALIQALLQPPVTAITTQRVARRFSTTATTFSPANMATRSPSTSLSLPRICWVAVSRRPQEVRYTVQSSCYMLTQEERLIDIVRFV